MSANILVWVIGSWKRSIHFMTEFKVPPLLFPILENNVRRALSPRFPYGVYFVVGEELISVLAVLHLHRHPDTWKGRI